VLIGIVDSINHLNYRNKKGALLSLDIKKAFDSTSHHYLQEAYRFFNFGPNFIKWLNLIGTNRKACIILDDGSYSDFFDLERGNAQGDTTSSYIFNIGFQILLLKLTFDLQIEGLIDFPVPPDNTPPLPRTVSTYKRKVSAYADDANMLTKLDYDTLLRVRTILEEFGTMSGLICNVEKTMLLIIGENDGVDNRIKDLGFVIVDKVTILGLEINGKGFIDASLNNITAKIKNQIGLWRRFNLSLPGRINIAKTMLYSQINYLGCFLPIKNEIMDTWDKLITDFVKGKLNVARSRLFKPPSDGGLGLFNIPEFLDSQKCAWIKRSCDMSEPWKVVLYISNFGCVYNCKSRNIVREEYPLLHGICTSYERMMCAFTVTNENFRKCYIFENEKISKTLESREQINRSMFTAEFFNINASLLYKLKYSNFYTDEGVMLTREQIRENAGLELTVLQYFEMQNACNVAKIKYQKKEIKLQTSVDIETYINRRKRGSSHLRKLFAPCQQMDTPHNIKKFADNMDIVINGEQSRFLNSMWNNNLFSNVEKMFLFKLHNNTLGYNNMVAHFVRGHSPYCTFCTLNNNADQYMESPSHLFYDCPSVIGIVDEMFCRFTNDPIFAVGRRDYFASFEYRELSFAKNRILTYLSKFIMKYVWDCKTRKFLPDIEHCWEIITDKFEYLNKYNSGFRKMLQSSNFNLQPHRP
jgi:hypothetical protein